MPIQRIQCALEAGRIWLLWLNEPEPARRCYLRALQEDAQMAEAVYWLGVASLREAKVAEAEAWFKMADALPDEPCGMAQQHVGCSSDLPSFGLAAVAANTGKFMEAYRLLDIAERKAPFPRAQYVELRKKLDRR